QRENVFRGSLGDLRSWHLHAWFHGDPFPQWVADLALAVESGSYPSRQAGNYDMRLDQPADRTAWLATIQGLKCRASASPSYGRSTKGTEASASQVPGIVASTCRDNIVATTVGSNGSSSVSTAALTVVIP